MYSSGVIINDRRQPNNNDSIRKVPTQQKPVTAPPVTAPAVKPIPPIQKNDVLKPQPQSGGKPAQTNAEDNQLIITALKKYIQIINEMRDLRAELKKREDLRAKLAPVLMEYMDKIDQKKIKTVQDTLTYTTYKSLEGYSKKSIQRMAYQFFQNQKKAEEFMEFCEKHRQTVERKGIKHTKPRVRKTKTVKVPKSSGSKKA